MTEIGVFRRAGYVRRGRPVTCHPLIVSIFYDTVRQTPYVMYVNKPKKTLPTSHTMSHSAQFHSSSILLCPKSFWKIKRIIRPARTQGNIGPMVTERPLPKTYDTPLLSRPRNARGTVHSLFLIFHNVSPNWKH